MMAVPNSFENRYISGSQSVRGIVFISIERTQLRANRAGVTSFWLPNLAFI